MPEVTDRCDSLETRYERLRYAYGSLIECFEELTEELNELHDIHLVTDGAGVVLQVNAAASLISPAKNLIGTRLSEWVVRNYRERFLSILADLSKTEGKSAKPMNTRLQRDTPDALQIDVMVQAVAVVNDGEVGVIHWILRPVNPKVEGAFQLQRPVVEFEHIAECAFKTDAAGNIKAVNAAFTQTTGYASEEIVGKNPRLLSSGLQDDAFYQDFWGDLLAYGRWQGLIFNRKKNGEIYCEWVTINAENDADGHRTGYTAVFFDMAMAISKKQQVLAKSLSHHVYRTQPVPVAEVTR